MNSSDKKIHVKWHLLFFTAALVLFMAASPSHALFGGRVESFSADNVEIAPDGRVVHTSKIFVMPDAMRMDGMPGMGDEDMPKVDLTMLILKKKNRQYFYNHDKKLVFESPVDEENLKPGYKALDNVESERVLGKEKVSGYKCIKKEVVTSYATMGMALKTKMIVWESDQFEFPLRTMDEDGAIQEMRNIKKGKPSKKLFKPLPGYKKVDSMMAVMGMDISKMMAQREEPSAVPSQNLKEMDVNEMMAGMKKAMGENADPETMAQLEQIMAQAMAQAKTTSADPGSAEALWRIIPKRPGDKIGSELKTPYVINVVMGSKAGLKAVFNYYQKKMTAKGWQDGGMYLQDGRGSMNMMKGQRSLTISWADDPGMEGRYTLFYSIQLTGPDI